MAAPLSGSQPQFPQLSNRIILISGPFLVCCQGRVKILCPKISQSHHHWESRQQNSASLYRQGWFDLQSTGSSWAGTDSEEGQTRAFLDGYQACDEGVSNAPLAHAAGLRIYYQRQWVRKHSTEKQTANQNNSTLSSPTKTNKATKPSALQRAGGRERIKA